MKKRRPPNYFFIINTFSFSNQNQIDIKSRNEIAEAKRQKYRWESKGITCTKQFVELNSFIISYFISIACRNFRNETVISPQLYAITNKFYFIIAESNKFI